jgi:predicted enzyme related to lactoylglutathione lyase
MLAPQDFAGGRFAILADPQGAAFGLLRMLPR